MMLEKTGASGEGMNMQTAGERACSVEGTVYAKTLRRECARGQWPGIE